MSKRYKVLITGSSGMLGTDLCQELGKSYTVAGLDTILRKPQPDPHLFLKGDITDERRTAGLISDLLPDAVVHTAAWTDVDGCELDRKKAYAVNSEGTKNVALACAKSKADLIYISTDFVFDGRKKSPYKETDRPKPLSVYGDSKLRGERFIKKYLKRYFIVRTGWLYGKRGRNFVDTILSKAKAGDVLNVVDDQIGSPTYTKDLAKALRVLLDRIFTQYPIPNTQYSTYHVSNFGQTSWYEYARTILRLAGYPTRVVPISSVELARPARRPAMSILNNSKFVSLTDYRMRNWKNALREYLKDRDLSPHPGPLP